MFAKLRTARFLKIESSSDGAIIGFAAQAARITRVHQQDLRDRVRPDGPYYRYPTRKLLGLNGADRAAVLGILLDHASV